MTDRERILKGLKCCANGCVGDCPYFNTDECGQLLPKDALELLKEQEPVPVDTKMIGMPNGTDIEVYCCRDCRTVLDPAFHYCPNCGQELDWNEQF